MKESGNDRVDIESDARALELTIEDEVVLLCERAAQGERRVCIEGQVLFARGGKQRSERRSARSVDVDAGPEVGASESLRLEGRHRATAFAHRDG